MLHPEYRGAEVNVQVPFNDPDWRESMMEFLSGGSVKMDSLIGRQIDLVGYIAKRTSFREPRTGSHRFGFFIGLVDANRNIIQTTSKSVQETLDTFTDLMGGVPFVPPIRVEFTEGKSSSGGNWQNLMYIKKGKEDDAKLAFPPAGGKSAKRS